MAACVVCEGLLQVDACIVAEDETHCVVGVRLAKETIRRNHRLLAALSDQSCGERSPCCDERYSSDNEPTHAPPPVACRRRLSHVAAIVGALLLSPITLSLNWILTGLAFLSPGPAVAIGDAPKPLEMMDLRLVTSTLKPGDKLQIVAVSRRTRVCIITVDRIILQRGTTQIVARERVEGSWQQVTTDPVTRTFSVKLPQGLPVGQYAYQITMQDNCGPGDVHHLTPPALFFDVVPAAAS